MIKKNQTLLNLLSIVLDGVLMILSIYLAFLFRFYVLDGDMSVPLRYYLLSMLVVVPVQLLVFARFRLYDTNRRPRFFEELLRILVSTTICLGCLLGLFYLLKSFDYSRLTYFLFYMAENALLWVKRFLQRIFLRVLRRNGDYRKRVVIIGSNVMAHRTAEELLRNRELGYSVEGYIAEKNDWAAFPYLGTLSELEEILETVRPDELFTSLTDDEYGQLERIIYLCNKNGIRFALVPYYSQFMTGDTEVDSLNGIPVLSLRKLPLDYIGNAAIKRAADIVGSLLLIIVTSPIMLLLAIGVKLSSPGPILFKQERVGFGKKPFMMLKFRSMRVNTEQNTGWTTDNDPRKTKFGSFIRKYSLDEFPQFFNVLKGDMSLVGPRPEVPFYVNQFKEEIPVYLNRQQVRPGITGWAQINGFRGDTSIEERVRYDCWYIQNWSMWLDIIILLRTVFGGFINSEKIVSEKPDSEKEDNTLSV